MMYLDHIKVLEPLELIEIIKIKAEQIHKIYNGEAAPMEYNHPYNW